MGDVWRGEGWEIYCGRCEDILSQLERADLVLTDPPYGLGEDSAKRRHSRGLLADVTNVGDEQWDDAPSRDLLSRVVAAGERAIVWGGNHLELPCGEPGWLVWDKDNGATDFADCELAWSNLGCAVRRKKHRWQGMLQEHGGKHKERRYHPTQKPVSVMRWCIELAKVPPGGLVIDPFMGSGTTLVAAREMGCRAIGIEQHRRFCEIATTRLAQRLLFGGANPKT